MERNDRPDSGQGMAWDHEDIYRCPGCGEWGTWDRVVMYLYPGCGEGMAWHHEDTYHRPGSDGAWVPLHPVYRRGSVQSLINVKIKYFSNTE